MTSGLREPEPLEGGWRFVSARDGDRDFGDACALQAVAPVEAQGFKHEPGADLGAQLDGRIVGVEHECVDTRPHGSG